MTSRKKEVVSALFWLAFAIYIAAESYRFGLGKVMMPGPGYFPFAAALLFGCISVLFLIKTLREAPVPEARERFGPEARSKNVVLNLIAMVAYGLFLNKVGFLVCTFLFSVFFLRIVAHRRWTTIVLVSLSVTIGAHLLFNVLLNVQLPKGVLPLFGS